eukprot:CAMPEP_0198225058 /NCGR_PEP_ID=MMETSP1445-20131203/99490_1 /TAXON_ID=36898 /ORGANISM="Pyramimonas sp., Strain CCMP2087" /LENGTH=46 /DNA_ID= /DNA_START= /DNA_END= /DNA_ORIENTATION=
MGRVIAVGSPMLDSYVQVDDGFLSQLGQLKKGDALPLTSAEFLRVV